CYNHEKFIERTLNSVVADTYPHKEIIIINDGSADGSDERIQAWIAASEHKGSVTYINRPNKGICATMNEMIGLAKGEYILSLASDDCLYGDTIVKRVKILEERPDKCVLLNDAYVIDDEDNIIMQSSSTDYWKAKKEMYLTDDDILESCIKAPRVAGPVIFYRKEIFNRIGKFPEDLEFEDWYFYQRAASLRLILFVDFKVALYRVHGGNFSGVNSPHGLKIAKATLKVYQLNFWFYPGVKYKLLGLTCYFRVLAWYFKLKYLK
ncbi:MAG: glycosyltransferase, partial [Ferruginibacter sp.]